MSTDNTPSNFLLGPNTLRKLAGKKDAPLLEHDGSEEEIPDTDAPLSVEIITLSQYKYEVAFEQLSLETAFINLDANQIAERIDEMVPTMDHIKPHIKVGDGNIVVVVNCTKVDTQIVEYASILLSTIPNLQPGYYWEYLTHER